MPILEKNYKAYQIFSNTLSLKINKSDNLRENNNLGCLKIDFPVCKVLLEGSLLFVKQNRRLTKARYFSDRS